MVKEQKVRAFYLGEDPFTGKIVETLFCRKGLEIANANAEKKLFINTVPGDLLLLDLPEQIHQHNDVNQVLLSFQPVQNQYLKYWCKTPLDEERLENLLFYIEKDEFLIQREEKGFTFSTKKIEIFVGDDLENKKEVISGFIDNLSTNYRKLEQAVTSDDKPTVKYFAHKMLSGSGYYGVPELERLLKLLENENIVHSREELLEFLDKVYEQVVLLRSALIRKFF